MKEKLFNRVLALVLSLIMIFVFELSIPLKKAEAFVPVLVLTPAIGGTVIATCQLAAYTYSTMVVVIILGNICKVYVQNEARQRFKMSESLPVKGSPNSVGELRQPDGSVKTRRWYDGKGNPVKDIDYTNHNKPKNHPNPHQHNWKDGVRSGPKPLGFWIGPLCNDKFCKYEYY